MADKKMSFLKNGLMGSSTLPLGTGSPSYGLFASGHHHHHDGECCGHDHHGHEHHHHDGECCDDPACESNK